MESKLLLVVTFIPTLSKPNQFLDINLLRWLFVLRATDLCGSANSKGSVDGNTVLVYSTKTGELVRELEQPNERIVNIQNSPHDPGRLYACTNAGQIVTWPLKTGGGINKLSVSGKDTGEVSKISLKIEFHFRKCNSQRKILWWIRSTLYRIWMTIKH